MIDTFDFTISFQRKLLHLLFIDVELLGKYQTVIQPHFFENNYHKIFCELLIKYYEKYNSLPSLSAIKQEIRGLELKGAAITKKDLRIQLKKVFKEKITDILFIKDKVLTFAKNQAMKEFILSSADLVINGRFDKVYAELEKATAVGSSLENLGMEYFNAKEIEKRIVDRQEGLRKDAVRTGIEGLDDALMGGLCPEETGIVIAPSGRGKSILLGHLGKAAIKFKKNVFIYTLELSERKYGNRMDSAIVGVRYHKLNEYPVRVRKRLKRLHEQTQKHLFIKYFPYGETTVKDIKAHIRMVESSKGVSPDMLVIDYGDLLKSFSGRNFNDSYYEAGNVFSEICSLGIELKIPTWTASQCNRAALSKEIITMNDIAESFKKVHRADVILGLCQTEEEQVDDKARLFLAKVRDTEDRKLVPIIFNKAKMHVSYDFERAEVMER